MFLTCSFLRSSEKSGDLNDFDITKIDEVDSPASNQEAVEQIFSLLPPRRFQHWFRDRSGQEQASQLTYALARQHSDTTFLTRARQLLCSKCSIDAHNLKFPIAAFENYEHLTGHWRPNLLASTVFILHGTQMEDNPMVQQAREISAVR